MNILPLLRGGGALIQSGQTIQEGVTQSPVHF
jgi:hypothetical protein